MLHRAHGISEHAKVYLVMPIFASVIELIIVFQSAVSLVTS